MKEIIKKWCETNTISESDAPLIIREYCKLYGNREVSDTDLQGIYIINNIIPINWTWMLSCIAIKYGYQLEFLYDQKGNLLKRYFIE